MIESLEKVVEGLEIDTSLDQEEASAHLERASMGGLIGRFAVRPLG